MHSSYRAQLRCRLAVQRAELLWQLVGLNDETLTAWPVHEGSTAKNMLAHLAARDELCARWIELSLTDRHEEMARIDADSTADMELERSALSLEQVLEACLAARARFLSALARVDDERLYRTHPLSNSGRSVDAWARERYEQDGRLARQIRQWRSDRGLTPRDGPRAILLAALKAGRKELLLTSALVPVEDRETRPVCGEWTLKDVLGHVTDSDLVGLEGLRQLAAGRLPQLEYDGDQEGWNRSHAEVRRGQPWEDVWHELHATRQELLKIVQRLSDEQLLLTLRRPWSGVDTAYAWISICLAHDREHAREVRAAIGFD